MNAHLTMLKLNFERQAPIFTYVWRDGMIDDFHNEPNLAKAFEPDGEGRFLARSNNLALMFQANGDLLLEQNGKQVRAKKYKK